ncbi:hypothetical protein [Amycolatopsis sp. FDAARGOS 1241]|uniref:hypothetical protein n=1 Tax=Amycolatopsis sp. FDAARGOS 1241 TaxID=2778070 RepID=UPI001951F81E|nr:hypothetical protein [Amycolatopsis sp. FDAARGOS 1241]QRP48939.1 hypothetical protein I6J71_14680 [Amycolatopsis sp. FDAARGOS 1241]
MPADPRPRLRLWHLTESRFSPRSPDFTTRTTAFTVRRPLDGDARDTVTCPWCGTELRLRVSSPERFRRSLRQWALGCAAALLTVAAGAVVVVATPLPVAGVVLLVGGFLAVVITAAGWWWGTGVRPDGSPEPHHIRPDRSRR